MMGQMMGPDGVYLLAKERQAMLLASRRSSGSAGLPLRVRLGRSLIAAGTAIGGERSATASATSTGRLRGRAASPTA